MTTVEQYNLQRCEAIIERNMSAFVEVGLALLEIREAKLYKQSFPTFDAYCRERWGMSKTHANRTIQASQFTNDIREATPIGAIPENEHQARLAIVKQNGSTETDSFVAVPVDPNQVRCETIMRELVANPTLARLVRIELMKWYALNSD